MYPNKINSHYKLVLHPNLVNKVSIVGLPTLAISKGIAEFKNNIQARDVEDIFQYIVSR
jgi:hypothetical protein